MKLVISLIFSLILICKADRWGFRLSEHTETTNVISCSGSADLAAQVQSEFSDQQTNKIGSVLNVSKVIELKIFGCGTHFMWDNSQSHKEIIELDKSFWNSFGSIFPNKTDFKKLNASHNELIKIPSNFFAKTPELTEIDFSHNRLGGVNLFTFANATKLAKIDLSHNQIVYILSKAFVNLSRLKLLDLRNNMLEAINFVFPTNVRPRVLHLENNPISYVTCDSKSPLANWTSTYISWKFVTWFAIERKCFANKVRTVPNSEHEGFLIGSDNTAELHFNANSFENLVGLTVEPNQIENGAELIQNLGAEIYYIYLSGNFIGRLNQSAFQKFNKLEKLFLSDTNLAELDFEILPQELKILDISKNHPIVLHNIGTLDHLNLNHLNLSRNYLENAAEIAQHLNEAALYLDLSGNRVEFGVNSFAKAKNIKRLFLRNVRLDKMKVNALDPLQSLEWLDISDNNLEKFNFELIATRLTKLTKFFVAKNCNIQNVPQLLGHLNKDLELLDLSGNFIGAVNVTTFNRFNFEVLVLKNANLTSFNFATLENHTRLNRLDLSHNNLKNVDFNALPGNSLKKLHLSDNELTEITNLERSRFPRLAELFIGNNHFSCESLNNFLMRIKAEFPNLKLDDDHRQQKHGMEC